MNKLSIIISISEYGNQLKKTLRSIKNQTLKNIEIKLVFHSKTALTKQNELKSYNSLFHAINDTNSEYVLFINENEFFQNDACELLYNLAKNEDLDLLYIPLFDENITKNKFSKIDESLQIICPFNFAQFCKKNILDKLDFCENIFYEVHKNAKKTKFFNQKIFLGSYLCQETIEKNTQEFLKIYPNKTDFLFEILLKYLINNPINLKQYLYEIIKYTFKNFTLNNYNQKIYKLITDNDSVIDFLTQYNLNSLDFEIYENSYSKKEDKNYKISVIIPIFNNETLIHRTLMSIENQSFGIENIEVLMINDASTDNTKNIINKYADSYPNFKAIHIKDGTGSAGTPRNLGLKLACGEYIIFLDHDDFFEINALEKLYNKITKYDCDFVYGTYIIINTDETIKFSYPYEKHGFFENLQDNNRSIIIPPSIWTKLFKKEFLLKNNILFPTILGEDIIFMAKALKNANGVYYLWNDVICYYNLSEYSYSTNISYNYFIEGFASENYLFNLFNNWEEIEYYKIRGPGILDFYMNRILNCNLSNEELENIFPSLYIFCDRLNKLNVNPKLKKNKIAFNHVINNDLESFLKFKNYEPNKIKIISNKILKKINKYCFW